MLTLRGDVKQQHGSTSKNDTNSYNHRTNTPYSCHLPSPPFFSSHSYPLSNQSH